MKLFKRAAGVLKDHKSIWVSSLSRRSPYRHPELEAAIIKATSHDATSIDYKNAKRVFKWIRTSPIYLKPLAWSLTMRMEKTRSWVVALKGLMLMHGVFCCRILAIQQIGRLPFDLSNFSAGRSTVTKNWGYIVFVRAYYAYLDHKSAFLFSEATKSNEKKNKGSLQVEEPLMEEITRLQKWQAMLDLLLEIRPIDESMKAGLILEAVNNLVIEIFDIYSRICNGIANVLLRIYDEPAKIEASMALNIIRKAAMQVDDLYHYLELCRDMGVINASQCPKLEKIPDEDIRELEQIIHGVSEKKSFEKNIEARDQNHNTGFSIRESGNCLVMSGFPPDLQKTNGSSINGERKDCNTGLLKTVITDKWEVFDGDCTVYTREDQVVAALLDNKPYEIIHNRVLPDLITF